MSGTNSENTNLRTIPFSEYSQEAALSDKLNKEDITPVILGLFGEVGSIMSVTKKAQRDENDRSTETEEEFGDALWYFAAICRRLGYDLGEIFHAATKTDSYQKLIAATDLPNSQISEISSRKITQEYQEILLQLGSLTADLISISKKNEQIELKEKLVAFADCFMHAMQTLGISFASVKTRNLVKIKHFFVDFDIEQLPNFDGKFPDHERIPNSFEIEFHQHVPGKCHMRMNNVFIGAPLTDSISDPDGYRFHDVFHLAFAAILHWSPVFRALLQHKRRSDKNIDENQDGGRAIVIEEGLSALLFAYAKQHDFFENTQKLPPDIMKNIKNFVSGYEVDQCPAKLWQEAILQGYKVFRELRRNNGGTVIGNRTERTIKYVTPGR